MAALTSPRVAPVLAALAGAALVAFAAPRAADSVLRAPYGETVAGLSHTPPPPPDELVDALANRRAALRDTPATHADIAALALARARALGTAAPRGRALLDLAIAELRAALAEAPAQPFTWAGLAYAQLARGADGAVGAAWQMAVRTAPADPALVMPRLALGFAAGPRLGADGRALLDEQIRLAARRAPDDLARFARDHFALGPVRAALAASPALRNRFDQAYLALR